MDLTLFPTINAFLNGLAGILLFLGYRSIKKGQIKLHKKYMVSALCCSAVFLVSYLTYHYLKGGVVTKFEGEGFVRLLYFFILITHTPLAAIIVPLSIMAVYFALKGKFALHVKITRWLYPMWIYVSITGVLIYLMLYILPIQ